jgi:hypothetical protein
MKQNIRFWASSENGPPPIRTCQIAGSLGILIPNTPLEIDSDGYVTLGDTDDTVCYGLLCGVVDRSKTWPLTAQLTAADEVRVAVVRAGDLWAVYCDNGGNDASPAQTNVFASFAITVDANTGQIGYVTCDIGDESGTYFTMQDLASNVEPALYSTSDSPGVAICKISATLQG